MSKENETKLGLLITHFVMSAGVLKQGDNLELEHEPLKEALANVLVLIRELQEKVRKVGKVVDVFWDRQGWYTIELESGKISQEYDTLDRCLKSVVLQGYIINDVRRSRGPAPQPTMVLPERKLNDAE